MATWPGKTKTGVPELWRLHFVLRLVRLVIGHMQLSRGKSLSMEESESFEVQLRLFANLESEPKLEKKDWMWAAMRMRHKQGKIDPANTHLHAHVSFPCPAREYG